MQRCLEKDLEKGDIAELEATDAFYLFWKNLAESKVENGLLHFAAINPFAEKCTSLVIRKSYEDIWTLLNKERPERSFYPEKYDRNMLVTGSPGVGKSMFLLFVMWKLKMEGKSVMYMNGEHDENYLFHNDKVFIADKDHYFHGLEPDDLWYLVKSERPLRCGGRTLMIASEDERQYKSFRKNCHFFHYYMPPWTFEDCLLKYENSYADKFTRAEFLERFEVAGGVPGHIFGDYEEYCEGLEEAINSLDFSQLESIDMELVKLDTILNRLFLFHIKSEANEEQNDSTLIKEESYKRKEEAFCSNRIHDLIVDCLFMKDYKSYIYESLNSPLGSIQSIFSLQLFLRILADGGTFQFRCDGGEKKIKKLKIPKQEIKIFGSLDEINEPGFYIPAERDICMADGIMVISTGKVFAIQVAMKEEDTFVRAGIDSLREKFEKIDLIFVVPERIFESAKISIHKVGVSNENEEEISLESLNIESKRKNDIQSAPSKKFELDLYAVSDNIKKYFLCIPVQFASKKISFGDILCE